MPYLSQNPLILVAILTILFSPFILKLASNQNKKVKSNLRTAFLLILILQIILGFLNWENFSFSNTFLALFFFISILQVFLLLINKPFNTAVVILNFINTILIFVGMIEVSRILGFQIFNLPSISSVFLVLLGNVIGLTFINKQSLKLS